MRKAIQTEKAPAAIGPYSQAIQAGDFLYISGQIPINPANNKVEEGIENQTKQVLSNLEAILAKAEASFDQAVKFTIYLSSMEDFKVVNEIYGTYLQEPYPARATVEVSRLPKDVLIEMDLVAYVK